VSYVQGTKVRLSADFRDPETYDPVAPTDIVLTVVPPTVAAFEARLSDAEIVPDPDRPGRYFYVLDTTPEPGTWRYQFESVGQAATVERKALTVTRRLTAV